MNTTTKTLLALAATGSFSNAALVATNLDFETGSANGVPTGWTVTSTGSDAIDSNADYRAANNEGNWHTTAGQNRVFLMEADNANEEGTLSQALTGTAEAGTYSFTLRDVGVANFGDNNNTTISYGFSSNGTDLDLGTAFTLVEGTDIFSPVNGSVLGASSTATYAADGTEGAIYLVMARTGGNTGRSVATVSYTDLSFTAAIPEPSSAALLGLGGLALILRRRK